MVGCHLNYKRILFVKKTQTGTPRPNQKAAFKLEDRCIYLYLNSLLDKFPGWLVHEVPGKVVEQSISVCEVSGCQG